MERFRWEASYYVYVCAYTVARHLLRLVSLGISPSDGGGLDKSRLFQWVFILHSGLFFNIHTAGPGQAQIVLLSKTKKQTHDTKKQPFPVSLQGIALLCCLLVFSSSPTSSQLRCFPYREEREPSTQEKPFLPAALYFSSFQKRDF